MNRRPSKEPLQKTPVDAVLVRAVPEIMNLSLHHVLSFLSLKFDKAFQYDGNIMYCQVQPYPENLAHMKNLCLFDLTESIV